MVRCSGMLILMPREIEWMGEEKEDERKSMRM